MFITIKEYCWNRLWIIIATAVSILILVFASQPVSKNSLLPVRDPLTETTVSHVETLDQGWSWYDRLTFYNKNQGSQLIPYKWALNLQIPSDVKLGAGSHNTVFCSENLARHGFLPQIPHPTFNPDGLALGFVRDPAPSYEQAHGWLGLTCAACHTSQVNFRGVGYLIDGGPGLGDIQSLLLEMTKAMQETLDDAKRFESFAKAVLEREYGNKTATSHLRTSLEHELKVRQKFDAINHSQHPYGFARVDAFGIIMNQVLHTDLEMKGNENVQEPNAPVSFPFLWDTPHHDFVQWNGIAPNHIEGTTRIGPLSRNVGEVLGVFGHADVKSRHQIGYPSSARRLNLLFIEEQVRELYSPQWPPSFPKIDVKLAEEGKVLFGQHCASCHDSIKRMDPNRSVVARMSPLEVVKTDETMVRNVAERKAKTGPLQGRRGLVFRGDSLRDVEPAGNVLRHVLIGVIAAPPKDFRNFLVSLNVHEMDKDNVPLQRTMITDEDAAPMAYKGRPLNGIWATAPYLHNGSVPSLDDLLKPASKRPKQFYLGTREFDPKKVGFVSDKSFEGAFKYDTTLVGNGNQGHEYGPQQKDGPGFNDDQRRQLIEYLKTL